ncbi:MAG: hypothetical protein HKP40_03465 [Litoreibacter sp.]|nr:hypothetical protein [Litoreibacter sp.]
MTSSSYPDKLAAMESGALEPNDFSHLDHVGVAVEALKKYGFFEAVSRYADGLRVLTEKAGVPEKFNATITFASMSLIAERLHSGEYTNADAFVQENGALFTKAFLTEQFPDGRYTSDVAREVPLLPTDQFLHH